MELQIPAYVRVQMTERIRTLPGIKDVFAFLQDYHGDYDARLVNANLDIGLQNDRKTKESAALFYDCLDAIAKGSALENVHLNLSMDVVQKGIIFDRRIATLDLDFANGMIHCTGSSSDLTLLQPQKLDEILAPYRKAA